MIMKRSRQSHLIFSIIILLISACVSQPQNDTQPLAQGDYSKQYQFTGDPQYQSRLSLSTQLNNITYSAQLSDFAGKVVSTVNDTTLQTMELIIPVGEKRYFVDLSTYQQEWLDSIHLTIQPMAEQDASDTSKFMNISYSQPQRVSCQVWSTQEATVYLYNQPSINAQPLLILPVTIAYEADARTSNGWYRLMVDSHTGWVNGNQVQLHGDCATLPVDTMIQSTSTNDGTNTAPYDVDRHYFDIHANQGGVFTNTVSYPNGDSIDLIQATVSHMPTDRTIGIVMTCFGTGIDALQWGYDETLALSCGDTLALGFTQEARDTQLTVKLPAVSGQQFVEYELKAMPIAPTDEEDQHVLYADSNQGGALQQTVSYPLGDTKDTVALFAHNLQETSPNNFREYLVMMHCEGTQTDQLRWGATTTALGCGDQLKLGLSHAESVRYLTIEIPPNDGQTFIDYTLYAIPSAPDDDMFWFGVDRDNGGVFNETLSAPMGDTLDTIEIVMSNLTSTAPNHFREMTLTLYCKGFNEGNIRWGLPDNASLHCGETVTTAFIHSINEQTIEIVPLDATVQSYVNYTLVVAPKPEVSILRNDK